MDTLTKQKPVACDRPTYRLTTVSVNTPSNSSRTQSQTKIVGTLSPNAVFFFLLVLPLSLSKLFIAVQSPNLVHRHRGDKETQKCPTILTETVALSNTEHNYFIYPSPLEKNSSYVSGVSVYIFVALWLCLYECVLQGPIRLKVPLVDA